MTHLHTDEAVAVGRDAVLEGILDERDEEQRRYFGLAVIDAEMLADGRHLVAAQLHQLNIVAHELHFALQRHLRLVGLIHRVAQQVAQLHDGLLRFVAVDLRQARDVVERVEEEMGVDLILQPGQFCLHHLLLLLVLPHHVANAQCNADDHQVD